MGKLINIDNGGTLTDICVVEGSQIWRTKTLTTPHDLSRCFFDGLTKASRAIYGEDDILGLLTSTDYIRYSTTQGTNALVERKGPRLGLILTGDLSIDQLRRDKAGKLFESLIGDRLVRLDLSQDGGALEMAAVKAVNALSSAGANRIVVAHGGSNRMTEETRLKNLLLRKFPQHLLGAVPILYSHEVVEDDDDARRTWTALFNAFLHPAMERFLHNAEHKLRANKTQKPLLIFRNDGHSARVAKTIALKTYSSGPRGGLEGARAIARHYGFKHLISMDIGGTTTDIGEIGDGQVRSHLRGEVEGVPVSFPLSDIHSAGVGGSSIIHVVDGRIVVGPESVGSVPGPACFALGGSEATITDAFLIQGLLDPESFFGGDLKLDGARARSVIEERVAKPLGLTVEAAAKAMEAAWVEKIAASVRESAPPKSDTVLAAFGGAGPLVACRIAEALGIGRVLVPGLAAVFSAFGLGFSDIGHQYEVALDGRDDQAYQAGLSELMEQADRGMFGEGFELDDCAIEKQLVLTGKGVDERRPLPNGSLPKGLPAAAQLTVSMTVTKALPQPRLTGRFGAAKKPVAMVSKSSRKVEGRALPLYRVDEQQAGAVAQGPAVLEEAFFTGRLDPGWTVEINDSGDILLSKS